MPKLLKKEPLSLTAKDYNVYSDLLKQLFVSPGLFVIKDQTNVEERIYNDVSRVRFDKITGEPIGETIPAEKYLEEKRESWFKWIEENFRMRREEQILSDFLIKNWVSSYKLEKKFNQGIKYVLITEKELDEIFKKGAFGWEKFYKKYPDAMGVGLISFSRAGFNFEEDKALVEIGTSQHYEMGQGFLVLLEKKSNAWIIQKKCPSWFS